MSSCEASNGANGDVNREVGGSGGRQNRENFKSRDDLSETFLCASAASRFFLRY